MSKKSWVKIKRGLIKDPKHRDRMGESVWLYLHILDRAEFSTGIVYDWKDVAEAEAMQMELRTLRYQRGKLQKAGYIICEQRQHSLRITITRWINPRDSQEDSPSSPQGTNPLSPSTAPQGTNPLSPSSPQGTNPLSPSSPQGTNPLSPSSPQGTNQGTNPLSPLSISSSTYHGENTNRRAAHEHPPHAHPPVMAAKKPARDPRVDHPAIQVVRDIVGRYTPKLGWDDIIATLGKDFDEVRLRKCATAWSKVTANMANLTWLFEWYKFGIPERQKPRGNGGLIDDQKTERLRQSHEEFVRRHGGSDEEN